jgi:hypothetical protein
MNSIEFRYDKKQVLQALRYHFLSRPEIKWLLIFVNVFAITAAVLTYFKMIQPLALIIFSFIWFLLMVVIWQIMPQSIYRKSMTFKDHFMMHFNDENVVLETERGQKGWDYGRFSKFVESPFFFHLYFDAQSFFLVPKDAFPSIPMQQEVRELLREKIGKK